MNEVGSGVFDGLINGCDIRGLDFVAGELLAADASDEASSIQAEDVSTLENSVTVKENFTIEEAVSLLRKFDDVSDAKQIEILCPTILSIAEQHGCHQEICDRILEICDQKLLNPLQNKLVRKFGICLIKLSLTHRALPEDIALWQEFFILLVGLEEPQFHLLLPILPKMDQLLIVLSNKSEHHSLPLRYFSINWLLKILEKGLHHTNGWIRLWSLQKFVDIPTRLISHQSRFLFDQIMPALNRYDTLWRLIEKGELDEFFKHLGTCMARMADHLNTSNKKAFYKNILNLFAVHWNPCALFFISHSFLAVEANALLNKDDFSDLRLVFAQIDRIQYPPLRIVTVTNFFGVIFRLTHWDLETIWCVSSLLKIIPNCACARKAILNSLTEQLCYFDRSLVEVHNPTVVLNHYLEFETHIMVGLETAGERFPYKNDLEMGISASVVWLLADISGIRSELSAELESSIVELIEYEVPDYNKVDLLLVLWLRQQQSTGGSAGVESLNEILKRYVLIRLFSFTAAKPGFASFINSSVYLPLIKCLNQCGGEGSSNATKQNIKLVECIFSFFEQASKTSPLSYEHQGVLFSVASGCLSPCSKQYLDISSISTIARNLAHTMFGLQNPNVEKEEVNPDEEYLRSQQLGFLLHCIDLSGGLIKVYQNKDEITTVLLRWLLQISELDGRKTILKTLKIAVGETKDLTRVSIISIIQRLQMVLTQERRTKNYLQLVESVLAVLMQENILKSSDREVVDAISSLFDVFMEEATSNFPMAVIVSEALSEARTHLEVRRWTHHLIRLAIFGPIQKKDTQTLYSAYQMAYAFDSAGSNRSNIADAMPKDKTFLVHQAAHVTRLNAISCTIFLFSQKLSSPKKPLSYKAANYFVQKIVDESTAIDVFKTRSYGLSLAHRQKTRLMQLLLLVVDYIDEAAAVSLFDYCVQAILDTSQQFSIKLLVEWITLRVCTKYTNLFEKFVGLESELARRRIGSVSSWINVLHHYYRSLPVNQICSQTAFGQLLPWCTAQNFAVRCTAIAAARKLCQQLAENNGSTQLNFIHKIVYFNMETTGNGNKIINNLCADFYFGCFDQIKHFDLETILAIFPAKTGLPRDEQIELRLLRSHFSHFFEVETGIKDVLRMECTHRDLAEAPSLVYSCLSKCSNTSPNMTDLTLSKANEEATSDLAVESAVQRKLDVSRSAAIDVDSEKQLIVVASLITKATNLGGLCRTCEIFGVTTLVLSNSTIVADPEFRSLSMSAQKWVDIQQVKEAELKSYLSQKRGQGFTILAAEQTTNSVPLEQYQFPPKCLLLMGEEKRGVPVELIRYVDVPIEITQLGRVRSLNVHVTAALFIYQFASQHRFMVRNQ